MLIIPKQQQQQQIIIIIIIAATSDGARTYLWTCASNQPVQYAQSNQNLHWPHFGYQRIQRFFMRTITKTRLYNSDPLVPHCYIVKLGFTGVYIIFRCGLQGFTGVYIIFRTDAVLTSTHNLCFERKYEKYQIFFSLKIFNFCW